MVIGVMDDKMKILLLDDIAANLNMLERLLVANDYQVLSASDPYDALHILANEPSIGAIVTDYMMPELKGFDFFKAFKALPIYKALPSAALPPCILITAWAQEFSPEDALKMGFHAVLQKPFPNKEILNVLHDIRDGKSERTLHALFINFDEKATSNLDRLSKKIRYPFLFKSFKEGLNHYKRDQFSDAIVMNSTAGNPVTKEFLTQFLEVKRINDQDNVRKDPIIIVGYPEFDPADFKDNELITVLTGPLNYRTLAEKVSNIHSGTQPNTPSKYRAKILLVDDVHSCLAINGFIMNDMGYEVVTAKSADAALELLFSDQGLDIDLVLSDYHMPEMDGLEFFHSCMDQRQKDPLLSEINLPFLMYSAYSDNKMVHQCECEGVACVLKKPLNKTDLKRALEKVLAS